VKIIVRSRQNHLFAKYKASTTVVDDKLIETLSGLWSAFVLSKLKDKDSASDAEKLWPAVGKLKESDIDERVKGDEKFRMNLEMAVGQFSTLSATCVANADYLFFVLQTAMKAAIEGARAKVKGGHQFTTEEIASLLEASRDVVSAWLDKQFGATVTDQRISKDLSSFWEASFFDDMAQLNVGHFAAFFVALSFNLFFFLLLSSSSYFLSFFLSSLLQGPPP